MERAEAAVDSRILLVRGVLACVLEVVSHVSPVSSPAKVGMLAEVTRDSAVLSGVFLMVKEIITQHNSSKLASSKPGHTVTLTLDKFCESMHL